MTKDGSYYFNAKPPSAVVLYGEARVVLGDQRVQGTIYGAKGILADRGTNEVPPSICSGNTCV